MNLSYLAPPNFLDPQGSESNSSALSTLDLLFGIDPSASETIGLRDLEGFGGKTQRWVCRNVDHDRKEAI